MPEVLADELFGVVSEHVGKGAVGQRMTKS